MVKKKFTGQTLTIIILVVLLLLAISFGAVYAYYSTQANKVYGTIRMANLRIEVNEEAFGDVSGGSHLSLVSSTTPVVPGEILNNTSFGIVNKSNTSIYLVVVYKVEVNRLEEDNTLGARVDIDISKPVISGYNEACTDYYYEGANPYNPEEMLRFRSLVYLNPIGVTQELIPVIDENSLMLHKKVGNDFQQAQVNFAFRAYAIASSGGINISNEDTDEQKCKKILDAIVESQEVIDI